jgi:hypothetical protein
MEVELNRVVVYMQIPTRINGAGGVENSHSADEPRQCVRFPMALCKGSGLVVDETMCFSTGSYNNVIVAQVKGRVGNIMSIVNIYDQRDTQTGVRYAQNLNSLTVI